VNMEELELELIDHGLDDLQREDEFLALYTDFENFGAMQKALESMGLEVQQSELVRIPTHTKKLSDQEAEDVIKLIEKMEDDDDVVNIFHNMDMSE
jgi:transcriptional/translational regulatory protein YebC/TACO1